MKLFREGLRIEHYVTSPAKIRAINVFNSNAIVEIKISEGRNRQVRKMCQVINHPVLELKRTSIGKLVLGNMKEGCWRYLRPNEISSYMKGDLV